MAPFRIDRDELEHELLWRLMQNCPVTLYGRARCFMNRWIRLRLAPSRVTPCMLVR